MVRSTSPTRGSCPPSRRSSVGSRPSFRSASPQQPSEIPDSSQIKKPTINPEAEFLTGSPDSPFSYLGSPRQPLPASPLLQFPSSAGGSPAQRANAPRPITIAQLLGMQGSHPSSPLTQAPQQAASSAQGVGAGGDGLAPTHQEGTPSPLQLPSGIHPPTAQPEASAPQQPQQDPPKKGHKRAISTFTLGSPAFQPKKPRGESPPPAGGAV
jgi:hypothetical protein